MRCKSKSRRQKQNQKIQDASPEATLEYFQISVNVLEARKLVRTNPHTASSYVVITLGTETHRTSVRKNVQDPSFREYFLFEWNATLAEVQRTSLMLAVMEPKYYAPPRLLGETSIDLASIWAQPSHQAVHKWAQLSLPHELNTGAVGFLKVDIAIVCRGHVMELPAIIENKMEGTVIPPSSIGATEQQPANYVITVYGAFGLPRSFQFRGARHHGKPPSTYVKVSFCGLSHKTALQHQNCNPVYSEQISIVETFPNICQLIRLEICSAETSFNNMLACADIHLGLVSHGGVNGFVPTFGPSLLHMYGNSLSDRGPSAENGPYYKGALLVSLRTVVPYYQQELRSTNVEPVTPIRTDDLWMWEDFISYCSILEVSMLDRRLVGSQSGVTVTVGDIPCGGYDTDKKSRKLHSTGSMGVYQTCQDYGHLQFGKSFPVLRIATRIQELRFQLFMNNMVRAVQSDLEKSLIAVAGKLKDTRNEILSDLAEHLGTALEKAARTIRMFLDIEEITHQNPGYSDDFKCHETEIYQKQLHLQKQEIAKVYDQLNILIKGSPNTSVALMAAGASCASLTLTKKHLKYILAEANKLMQKINDLVFSYPSGWPDLVVWLLNGRSKVAYYKIPLADTIYSDIPEQCGRRCGRIQTIYLKPLKCSKHLNTLPNCCTCVAGKIETLLWTGLFTERDQFQKCLPASYKLVSHDLDMCIKTSLMMLQCRVFINRAKLNVPSDNSMPNLFVRVNALNCVKQSEVQLKTATPVWNVVLKIQNLICISRKRLKACPPTIVVEVLECGLEGKTGFLGRIEVYPAVDDKPDYQFTPKLEWLDIHDGSHTTGQIFMSSQIFQVPETLMKLTSYTSGDETNRAGDYEIPTELDIEKLPSCLIPKLCTYKVDVYWWGLRNVSIADKPSAVLEMDEFSIKSNIITKNSPNCNFPNGRTSQIFNISLDDASCPPLMIKLCGSSTFGRTVFMGSYAVKNPKKYFVDWLPKYARDASLKSASIMSSNFCKVSDTIYIKKNVLTPEESTDCTKVTVNTSVLETRKKKRSWKALICRQKSDEEEIVLLPTSERERENVKEGCVSPVGKRQDWWLRFFASLQGKTSADSIRFGKIKIYYSELELQPEFNKFKDWCKTLKLYCSERKGTSEQELQHQGGFIKAAIALYHWPPPADTVAVTYSGVQLRQGFFEEYPVNEPKKFLVRVYIVRGVNIIPRSFTGQSNPYIVITCGSKHYEDNNCISTKTVNPVFGKMYQFQCGLPEDYLLNIALYERESLSPDDLIGCTAIDLEDRVYSKHRACVGLATDYKVTGPGKWRDCAKPSAILEEVCSKNHIPAPTYIDGTTVMVNDVQYKDTDDKGKTYISASERKENICLELLHKWQTLPHCGYHLVPEHVETRRLFHPAMPELDQGRIQMWIDIFPLDTGTYIPLPVDIAPRKIEDYELRLTVLSVQDVPAGNETKNIYVKAWIGDADNAQYTDIQTMGDEGHFNWRMIFHFQYQQTEKAMINKETGPFAEEEEHLPPVLVLQVLDCDAVSNVDLIGNLVFDLNCIPRCSKICKLHTLDNMKRVNLFSVRNIRGWWPLKDRDINTGAAKFAGLIDLEMSLMPREAALQLPVGLGRDTPLSLPEHKSHSDIPDGTARPFEAIAYRTGIVYLGVGLGLLLTFIALLCWCITTIVWYPHY